MDQDPGSLLLSICNSLSSEHFSEVDVLTKSLKSLAQALAQDVNLREELGQNVGFWDLLRQALRKAIQCIKNEQIDNPTIHTAVQTIFLLSRNLVAQVNSNQQEFFKNIHELRDLILYLGNNFRLKKSVQTISPIVLETLSNTLTQNSKLVDEFWQNLEPKSPEDLISPFVVFEDKACAFPALILVLNCIDKSPSHIERLLSKVTGQRFVNLALDWANENDTKFNIAYEFITKIIEANLFTQTFDIFKVPHLSISVKQITLLRLLDAYISSEYANTDLFVSDQDNPPPQLILFLTQQIPTCINTLIDCSNNTELLRTIKEDPKSIDQDAELELRSVMANVEATTVLTTIATEIDTSLHEFEKTYLRKSLATPGLTSSLIKILQKFRDIPQFPSSPGRLSSCLVSLLGTLAHEQVHVQDQIRNEDGLRILLNISKSKLDDPVAPAHERVLFAITNCIQDNTENQRVIKELRDADMKLEDEARKQLEEEERKRANNSTSSIEEI